jgi:fluoroquinolone resistance protein
MAQLRAPPAAGAHIEGQTLAGVDWTDADLSDAVFTDCVIEDAQFSNTLFQGARFRRCRILRCRAAHADLRETSFEDCGFADPGTHTGLACAFSNLEQARFLRCDLTLSLFDRSSLYDVEMRDCNLRGARFPRAEFAKAFSRKMIKTSAVLTGCNFELAELADVGLAGCDLSGSDFREADLGGADLEGADMRDCDLFGAALSGAKLAGADLRGAEVSGLNLASLASCAGLKITADQQYRLLTALGVDVHLS